MHERLWNRDFVLCLMLQTLYMFSFNMVTPLVAQYVVLLGESTAMAGVVAGMFSFLAFAFRPFVGFETDRVNRKRFMLLGFALCVFAMAGYGLSSTVFAMAAFRVVHAFALSVQTTVITVMAVDYIPRGRIAEGVGYVGIAAMVGMSLGPGCGVLVAEAAGHQASFFGGALVMLAGVAFAIPLPGTPAPSASKHKGRGRLSLGDLVNIEALPLSVAAMSFAFCAGLTSSFIVLLGSTRGIAGIALFFFVSSLGMVFVRPLAGRYTDRRGIRRIGFCAFVSECLAMIVVAFSSSLPAIAAGAVFRTFGQGMAQSSFQGQVLKDASDDNRGVASSTFYLGIDAGQGLGAMVGGMLAGCYGYTVAFLAGPCMLAVGLISFLVWGARRKASRTRVEEKRR